MRLLHDLLARAVVALFLLSGAWLAHAQQPPMAVAPASVAAAPASGALPPIQAPAAAVANPYGLQALWAQGDWVARITLLILAVMSLASWYVLISKLVAQSRMGGQARAANASFWKADTVRQGAEALQKGSPYRFIAESALEATRKHGGLIGQVDLNTWVAQSIERAIATVHSRTQEGLAVLATVGSTAPFVGLFGTVWGIYNALVKIGATGQASIDKVAGPVGEALIMTALGLAVAVPAVLGYNWLVRRNKVGMDMVRAFGSDLHTVLLAGAGK
ncbi:MotA/TolQ/ExbB proton channel family protein [Ramlibacter solisilvae]|uniref:Biopolymer transport protein ExbB n=1 Tax=Ramlibacter tataouinensis TaxID=94132 RepID=A0A127JTV9_9BURK|nr:MotA/TolQ/ExbB proton channel family protein [Ramlibacter tataouinensis]AMO23355.1 biopolymer transporter ExbB [Ramlibacter tataouinensis]